MRNKYNIGVLFFVMVVIMIGFGGIIPILPFYVESLGASATELGILTAIYSVMQFIFAPIWGTLSDRFGRKPILVIGLLGNALSMFLFGLSNQMWMLYLTRASAGILSSATMPTAMAIVGDTTEPENRSGGMGALGAAMGIGMILGPGMGGLLADISLSTPFFVAAAFSLVGVALVLFTMPESLAEENRVRDNKVRGPQFSVLWKALWGPIGFFLVLAFIVSFGLTNFEGIFSLYAQHRYNYNPQQVGLIMSVVGIVSAAMQGLLTGPLTKRFGESNLIKFSLISSAIAFVLMLMPRAMLGVYLAVGYFVFSNAMLRPAISSIISRNAESGQGVAMGLNNSFMSLGRIIGPIWAGTMFDMNISWPFISGGVVMFVLFIISLVWMRGKTKGNKQRPTEASLAAN